MQDTNYPNKNVVLHCELQLWNAKSFPQDNEFNSPLHTIHNYDNWVGTWSENIQLFIFSAIHDLLQLYGCKKFLAIPYSMDSQQRTIFLLWHIFTELEMKS